MNGPSRSPAPSAAFMPSPGIDGFAAFSRALTQLRLDQGAPSFAELTRRVAVLRERRGTGAAPGRVTVYDCFRPDRRRIDADLVGDIVLALGVPAGPAEAWRRLALRLAGATLGDHVVVTELGAGRAAPPASSDAPPSAPAVAPGTVLVITGLPGVGKSMLARRLAEGERAAGRVDLALRVELRGYDSVQAPVAAEEALRGIARTLGARTEHRAGAAILRRRIAEACARRPTLLLLEDAATASAVAPLLIGTPGAHILVTSRAMLDDLEAEIERGRAGSADRSASPRVRRLVVEPLTSEQAIASLERELGDRITPGGNDAIARLARASGGIRLDLSVIARFVRDNPRWSLDDVAERFESSDADERVRPFLRSTVATLDDDAMALFRSLGLLSAPIHRDIIGYLAPGAGIDRLTSLHLVESESGLISMHDTVRAFARRLALDTDPLSVRREFGRTFVRVVAERSQLDRVGVGQLHAAALLADELGLRSELVGLAQRFAEQLGDAGYWAEAHDLLVRADASAEHGERGDIAELLARASERLGDVDAALAALHRAERIGTEAMPGRRWNIIGNVHRMLGRYDLAEEAYRTAGERASAAGNGITEGRAIGNLADLSRLRGRSTEAAAGYEHARQISESAGDEVNLAIIRSNRAMFRGAIGLAAEALADIDGLIRHGTTGFSASYLRVVRTGILVAAGDIDEAAATIAQCRAMLDGSEGIEVEPELDVLEAHVQLARGRFGDASAAGARALREAREVGWPLVEADALNTLAEIAVATGEFGLAGRRATAAQSVAEAIGDPLELARSLAVHSAVLESAGDPAAAGVAARRALDLLESIGHVRTPQLRERVALVG